MTAASNKNSRIAPQRSKRLRKKLFQDEFATYGFELECTFKDGISEVAISQFVDSFFIDAINAQGLAFGGGLSSKRLSGFVVQAYDMAPLLKRIKLNCSRGLKPNRKSPAPRPVKL